MFSLQLLIDLPFQDIPLKLVLDPISVFQSCNVLAAKLGSSYNDLLKLKRSGHLPLGVLSYDSRSNDSEWICLYSAKKVRLLSFMSWKKKKKISPLDWLKAVKIVAWMERDEVHWFVEVFFSERTVFIFTIQVALRDFEWHQDGWHCLTVRGRIWREPGECPSCVSGSAPSALGKLRKFPCQIVPEIKKGSCDGIAAIILRICAPLWV